MSAGPSILSKTASALAALIQSQGWEWLASVRGTISRGPTDEDFDAPAQGNALPSVVCSVTSANPISPQTATFNVECEVIVRHSADDTDEFNADSNGNQVCSLIWDTTFPTLVTAAGEDLTVMHCNRGQQSFETSGRLFVQRYQFTLFAAGNQLA